MQAIGALPYLSVTWCRSGCIRDGPGWGKDLSELRLANDIRRLDGIDWYWGWSMVRAVIFLWRERPHVLILQWWTGAVLHSYLLLA